MSSQINTLYLWAPNSLLGYHPTLTRFSALEGRGTMQQRICLGICYWTEEYSRPWGQDKMHQIRVQSQQRAQSSEAR